MTKFYITIGTIGFVLALLIPRFQMLAGCAEGSEPPGSHREDRIRAEWKPMQPPRSGLRCWGTSSFGHGAVYCEPDPSATHGATQ